MFISKEKYEKIVEEISILKEKDKEMQKIVDEEYGDSLVFLRNQWGTLAWISDVPHDKGLELLDIVEKDVRALIGNLIKKKKEVKDGSKKGIADKDRTVKR